MAAGAGRARRRCRCRPAPRDTQGARESVDHSAGSPAGVAKRRRASCAVRSIPRSRRPFSTEAIKYSPTVVAERRADPAVLRPVPRSCRTSASRFHERPPAGAPNGEGTHHQPRVSGAIVDSPSHQTRRRGKRHLDHEDCAGHPSIAVHELIVAPRLALTHLLGVDDVAPWPASRYLWRGDRS